MRKLFQIKVVVVHCTYIPNSENYFNTLTIKCGRNNTSIILQCWWAKMACPEIK